MHDVAGKDLHHLEFCKLNEILCNYDMQNDFVHSSMVDETYQLVGSHVDANTQEKIMQGKYVDFSRLIPKDRVLMAGDSRYEMKVRDGSIES